MNTHSHGHARRSEPLYDPDNQRLLS